MSKKEKACGGVIVKGGKVLMVLQDNGVFAFPKGHVEEGETEEETALREILEETGLKTRLDTKKRIEFGYHISDKDIDKTVVLFVGEQAEDGVVRAQEGEISRVEWVEIPEVEKKLQFEEWKNAWEKARKIIKEEE